MLYTPQKRLTVRCGREEKTQNNPKPKKKPQPPRPFYGKYVIIHVSKITVLPFKLNGLVEQVQKLLGRNLQILTYSNT